MSQRKTIEHKCHLVLELVTPLHIGSGEPDGECDAGVVRDFNGLPGIPGTSFQGLLRAEAEEALLNSMLMPSDSDKEKTDKRKEAKAVIERIFGAPGFANRGTGCGGRLHVSWGVIHNSHNQPVRQRLTAACRDSDPVLRDAARSMLRDHVKLNERGVADTKQHGKFDELVVSAGHRFTVELQFVTAPPDDTAERDNRPKGEPEKPADWQILATILDSQNLCLGGKTRRGLGAFKIIERKEDASSAAAADAQTANTPSLQLPPIDESLSRKLVPETLWMFGGGASEAADSAPISGTRIVWDGAGGGTVQPVWVISGSAVKGALRHRTYSHANRLAGNFIDRRSKDAEEQVLEQMIELFGEIEHGGKPGKLFIDDLCIPKSEVDLAPVQNHVAINPFTGGAKDSALFNDQPLQPQADPILLTVRLCGDLKIKLTVQVNGEPREITARDALEAALDDLAAGRLALGARACRGYGFFKSSPEKQSADAGGATSVC
jgi:CRISPR/Cas system CSM-associated protein Csm3 (group 7 of RAMP superfamily)